MGYGGYSGVGSVQPDLVQNVSAFTPKLSYQGEPYRSLSQVAHRITGTKWNGLVFFGLKPRAEKRP